MGEKEFYSKGNCDKLKGKFIASVENLSYLQKKITGEQAQINELFFEIEDFLSRKKRQIDTHKHIILQAQRESKEVSDAAVNQLTELLNS